MHRIFRAAYRRNEVGSFKVSCGKFVGITPGLYVRRTENKKKTL